MTTAVMDALGRAPSTVHLPTSLRSNAEVPRWLRRCALFMAGAGLPWPLLPPLLIVLGAVFLFTPLVLPFMFLAFRGALPPPRKPPVVTSPIGAPHARVLHGQLWEARQFVQETRGQADRPAARSPHDAACDAARLIRPIAMLRSPVHIDLSPRRRCIPTHGALESSRYGQHPCGFERAVGRAPRRRSDRFMLTGLLSAEVTAQLARDSRKGGMA